MSNLPKNFNEVHQNGHKQPSASNGFLAFEDSHNFHLENADFHWQDFLGFLKRRSILISIVGLGVTSLFTFQTLNQLPIYEGKFQLLMPPKSQKSSIMSQLPSLDLGDAGIADNETQMQVLRSPKIMYPIIQNLQSKYPELNYKSLVLGNQLSLNILEKTNILEIKYQGHDRQKINFVLQEVAKGYIDYSVASKQASLVNTVNFVDQQLKDVRKRVNSWQGRVQSFRQSYNLFTPEDSAKQVYSYFNDLEQKKIETQSQISESQVSYNFTQKRLGIPLNTALASLSLQQAPRYQTLLNSYSEISQKIAIESSRFQSKSPNLQLLESQRSNLLPLIRQESQLLLGVNNISALKSSPNPLQESLTQKMLETANQIQMLQVRNASINQQQSVLSQAIKQQPLIARQYVDIQRELQVATESLSRFLAAKENFQIEMAKQQLPWDLIFPPQKPDDPLSNNMVRNLIFGFIFGVSTGMAAGLLVDKLDNVFHDPEEIASFTKLPLLGIIPFQKQLKIVDPQSMAMTSLQEGSEVTKTQTDATTEELPNGNKRTRGYGYNSSPFVESFRNVYTNIQFLSSDQPTKSIVISSTLPGDGKSTVSAQLAKAASAMGQRVLLVDADLRLPRVHQELNLSNIVGLSNMIVMDLDPEEIFQQVDGYDDLYVLTAGQIPPDVSRLLSSKKMKALQQQFASMFDLVIYDTPPLLALADARLLAAHADGIAIVVGLGKTDKLMLRQAMNALKTSRASLLGVIANGVHGYTPQAYDYYDRYYNVV
jgi:polysaccharide biosynthesis transport protein